MAIYFNNCLAQKNYPPWEQIQPRSLIYEASIVRGPLVSEASIVACCVRGKAKRETRWFRLCFR
jgi:hypothetical protein